MGISKRKVKKAVISREGGTAPFLFALKFFLLFLFLNIAFFSLPEDLFLIKLINSTAKICDYFLSSIEGRSFLLLLDGNRYGLTTPSGIFIIVSECTGIVLIFAHLAFVLTLPGVKAKTRLLYGLAGSFFIYVYNVFRIVASVLISMWFPASFEFLHSYLFAGLLTVVIVIFWIKLAGYSEGLEKQG